jgi:hypothetical protein
MMARTAAEQDLDLFMSMINQACAAKLKELAGLTIAGTIIYPAV